MSQNYLIFMDVSGDIDSEIASSMDLRFLPMDYTLGDETRVCAGIEDAEILKKFYDGQRKGDLTKTSQITPFMYEEILGPVLEEGYSVLYLCLSGGLSSSFDSACMASALLKEKYPEQDFMPINSFAATGGMGVLAERALRNRDDGLSISANYKDLLKATSKIKHYFMVQDLNYLKRGGRVSAATAAFGTMLNVRPILEIDSDGKLQTIAKKRGNKAAMTELIRYFRDTYNPYNEDVIYVVDADITELGDSVADQINELYPQAVVKRTTLSPIIGAHTGPGMIAVCYLGK